MSIAFQADLSLQSVAVTENPLLRPTVVPLGKTVGFVLRNFERPPKLVSRPTWNGSPVKTKGLPDTCPFPGADPVLLNRPEQAFWFVLLKSAAPGLSDAKLKTGWRSLTADDRALTNGAGSDTRADWVNGTNTGAGPMRFIPMTMGGGICEIVGDGSKGGEPCWEIVAYQFGVSLLTAYNCFWATNSQRDQYNDVSEKWAREDIEEPFYQLDGANVPVPMFNNEPTAFVPKNRVRVLDAGTLIPSPYNR